MLPNSKAFSFTFLLCLCTTALFAPALPRLLAQSPTQAPAAPFAAVPDNQPPAKSAPTAQLQRRGAPYRLRQGDVIELVFELCPEFNQDVAVQPDGRVSARGVPPISVEGLSLSEVTASVTKAYTSIMKDPVVAVSLKDFERPFFIASGEVNRPGKYDLRSSLTITEAVAIAGGFDKDAKHSQVVLFRPVGDDMFQSRVVDVKKLLAERDLNQDVRLLPGDVLYVPKSRLSYVRPYLPSSNVFFNPFPY